MTFAGQGLARLGVHFFHAKLDATKRIASLISAVGSAAENFINVTDLFDRVDSN